MVFSWLECLNGCIFIVEWYSGYSIGGYSCRECMKQRERENELRRKGGKVSESIKQSLQIEEGGVMAIAASLHGVKNMVNCQRRTCSKGIWRTGPDFIPQFWAKLLHMHEHKLEPRVGQHWRAIILLCICSFRPSSSFAVAAT